MRTLIAIGAGIVIAIVLAPLLLKLARRWQRGTAAYAAGVAAGGGGGDIPEGAGDYIKHVRGEASSHGESGSGGADSSGGDTD